MAENYKFLYEQMRKMVEDYQDVIVPGLRKVIADPESLRPKARWITDDKGVTYCGRCRRIDDYASVHNYCPYCGAKMEV